MRKQIWQNLIVGIFVFGVLLYGAYFIYQTSEESTILLNKITVTTTLKNANGLKRYSPVRVHGISVGKVESIRFSDKPGEDMIYVTMSLNKEYVGRIAISNPDPEADVADPEGVFGYFYVSSEGLLGDNLLDIYAGDPKRATKAAEKAVRARVIREVKADWEATGAEWDEFAAQPEIEARYQKLIKQVKNLKTGYIADGSSLRTKPGGGGLAAITESLDPTLKRVNDLLDAAKTQPGLIHTLVYDEKGKELMTNLTGVSKHVEGLLADVRQGPGGLHDVIYGSQLTEILNEVAQLARKLDSAMSDVKSVTGDVKGAMGEAKQVVATVKDLLADIKEKDIVGNVKGTVANVEDITRKINQGEGTLGLLVTDKSLYEDLQELLGGAKRNVLIREALRYVRARNRTKTTTQKPPETTTTVPLIESADSVSLEPPEP